VTDTIQRLAASLSDRYRLDRELGQGGMATVYLAEDLKHSRKVAIKVLHPELSAVIGGDRFLTEIKVTANLQHPHILGLIDSGAADGLLYYVMPYVSGETLRGRLTRERQLPVEDALRLSREVAAALDYAHRQGVVHRDIKPENILLQDGSALVADFGIALAVQQAGGSRMTQTGMSLGTPAYMSPEQAMGDRDIGARSDVYALGAMTYEMLTGEPPFTGLNSQAIVAKVLTETPPPLRPKRPTVSATVEGAVLTALQKLPADRFGTAKDFADALDGTGKGATYAQTVQLASRPHVFTSSRPGRALALAAAAALVAAIATWAVLRNGRTGAPVTRYSMGLPPSQAMRQGVLGVNVALSPDGRRLVYIGPGEGGDQLWVRERDRLDATPLPGTVGAQSPFFSPDGERIAYSFGVNVQVKVVPVSGGPPITLSSPGVGSGGGGAWAPDGWIYFDSPGGFSRVRGDGGTPELFIPLDTAAHEIGHAWPAALPNNKGLLYRSRRNLDPADFDLVAYDFATKERHVLTKGLLARYVAPGYLVFLRADGAVMAAPFDQDKLRLTGPAVPLFEGVMTKPFGSADIAVSATGTLVYVPGLASSGGGVAELVMVSREGVISPLNPQVSYNPANNAAISLSPDGSRVAFELIGASSPDIWIKQLPSGPMSRLTFDPRLANRPRWTPDGKFIVYIAPADSAVAAITAVWKKRADGSTPPELLWKVPGVAVAEAFISNDGQWLVYRQNTAQSGRDIYAVRPGRDSTAIPLLTDAFSETGAALSPDGKWLAYTSNESGREEIFVRPFPNTAGGRWQASTAGGSASRWAHSGRELFFEAPSGDMMVVPVTSSPTFTPGAPRRLFPLGSGLVASNVVPRYDLTPDDQRFVMVRLSAVNQAPGAGQLVVVENWFTELKSKMTKK